MPISRNQTCPCGSSRKYKECCGYLFDTSKSPPRAALSCPLPIGRSFDPRPTETPIELAVAGKLSNGNLAMAEAMVRTANAEVLSPSRKLNQLGWIACAIGEIEIGLAHFQEAANLSPEWKLPALNIALAQSLKEGFRGRNEGAGTAKNRGYLLIRAWGCGFWSDVFHVLGQFLLAEITERRPVVYWGGNSLFSDNPTKNAFSDFFVDSSSKELDDVLRRDKSFWPQKWNVSNILGNDVNKFDGPFSRMAALYYLTRTEDVLVSDFYSGVVDLLPWIPASHSQFGKSVDEVYRYLFSKYLFPTNDIVNQVDAFVSEQLASRPFMAVHLRGSDKIEEVTDLNQRNVAYFEHIDAYLAKSDGGQIFLMTDDNHILVQMKTKYGNRILNTNSRRTSSAKGVHYQAADSRKLLGIEVMIDTYIAAKANCFVGNGGSNVSLAVSYIGSRDRQSCQLIGNNVLHGYGHLWSIQNW